MLAALLALNILGGADGYLTARCLQAGACVEVGPLYRPFASRPALLVGVKAGAMFGTTAALRQVHKRRPRAAWVLTAGLLAGQAYVVVHNWKVAR